MFQLLAQGPQVNGRPRWNGRKALWRAREFEARVWDESTSHLDVDDSELML